MALRGAEVRPVVREVWVGGKAVEERVQAVERVVVSVAVRVGAEEGRKGEVGVGGTVNRYPSQGPGGATIIGSI